MNPEDRRVRRTQKLLMDALIALSLEHGYDTITIRDITEKADVSYSTFFRHYTDKDSLLATIMKETVEALVNLVKRLPENIPLEVGRLLFHYAQEQEALFRVVFSGNSVNHVMQEIEKLIQDMLIEQYQNYPSAKFPLEIVAHQLMTSILSLVKWWLTHHMPYPVEQMAEIYSNLIFHPIELAAFGDKAENT